MPIRLLQPPLDRLRLEAISFTVANPATWSVGQGIAVAGAGAGGAELVTSVTAINGDVFTLAENALTTVGPAAAVNHDDTAAFASAIALAQSTTPFRPIQLQAGTFNVTNVNTLTEAVTMFGAGSNATFIQNRGTANDVFDVTANVTFADFFITQAAGITPTAGYVDQGVRPCRCMHHSLHWRYHEQD